MTYWQIEYTDVYSQEIAALPQRYYIQWYAKLVVWLKRRHIQRTQPEGLRDTVQLIQR